MNAHVGEIVIEAGKGTRRYWSDLWIYRELLYFLAWRDILVRYKQTVIGVAWALIQPLLFMSILTFVFGRLAKLPAGGVPYPLLVLTGLLPWLFFSQALTNAGNSLVGNANMVSKIYFPRMIIPLSAVVVCLVDFTIAFVLLLLLALMLGALPDWRILALPCFLALAFVAAAGAGLWIGALTVKYRDFRYVIPFLVQAGMYISPVGFNAALVPEKWKFIYSLNPMVGVIDGFRWSFLAGQSVLYLPGLFVSALLSVALLLTGVRFFRKTERRFADII
ncbi:MAG: ABC transporter permease [Betaproteobacteria bacterium]|nr:MAG: ABC transporter permease [Betaproteobacteria bacterium]